MEYISPPKRHELAGVNELAVPFVKPEMTWKISGIKGAVPKMTGGSISFWLFIPGSEEW